MSAKRFTFALVALILGSCTRTPSTPTEPQSGVPEPKAEFQLTSCQSLNGVKENCYWHYRFNPEVCSASKPCSKLLVFFSGGEMSCDDAFNNEESYYAITLKSYADSGYVTACLGTFLVGGAGHEFPFHQMGPRVQELMIAVRSSPVINEVWNGEEMLVSGISNGATTPLTTMARTTYDNTPYWHASKKTAACFLDGVYDIMGTNAHLKSSPISCNEIRNAVICRKYLGVENCADPSSSDANIIMDTITTLNPASLPYSHFKLIECGSAIPAPYCLAAGNSDRDWIPKEGILATCNQINTSATKSCEYGSIPNEGHLSCFSTPTGIASCKDWFEAL